MLLGNTPSTFTTQFSCHKPNCTSAPLPRTSPVRAEEPCWIRPKVHLGQLPVSHSGPHKATRTLHPGALLCSWHSGVAPFSNPEVAHTQHGTTRSQRDACFQAICIHFGEPNNGGHTLHPLTCGWIALYVLRGTQRHHSMTWGRASHWEEGMHRPKTVPPLFGPTLLFLDLCHIPALQAQSEGTPRQGDQMTVNFQSCPDF